jgi:hypothetical protein
VFATLAYYWSMRGAHSDVAGFGSAVLRGTRHYVPDAAHLTPTITTYTFVCMNALFGDLRSGMLARGRLRSVKRLGVAEEPRIEAMSNLVLVATDPQRLATLLAEYRESANAGVATLSTIMGAQLEENAGEVELAIASSRHAYDLAVQLEDVWMQATAAQGLASLYSQHGVTDLALEWAEKSRQGMSALQANGDLQQLSWLIAMNQLPTAPARARVTFEALVSDSAEELGADYVDLRSIGWAGLAEIALGEGRIDDGLRLYRHSVDTFGQGHGRAAPWFSLTAGGCVCAHVRAGSDDQPYIEALARRIRTRLLVSTRLREELADMPVSGAAITGLSAWVLSPGRSRSTAARGLGLRLLFLAAAMGGRQDLPSLNHQRQVDAARAAHGSAAVDTARASVAGLSPRAAHDLTCELLRAPELRELLAAG